MRLEKETALYNRDAIKDDIKELESKIGDTPNYFWFEGSASSEFKGAHVTQIPEADFRTNPSGGNVKIDDEGLYIQNGNSTLGYFKNNDISFYKKDNTTSKIFQYKTLNDGEARFNYLEQYDYDSGSPTSKTITISQYRPVSSFITAIIYSRCQVKQGTSYTYTEERCVIWAADQSATDDLGITYSKSISGQSITFSADISTSQHTIRNFYISEISFSYSSSKSYPCLSLGGGVGDEAYLLALYSPEGCATINKILTVSPDGILSLNGGIILNGENSQIGTTLTWSDTYEVVESSTNWSSDPNKDELFLGKGVWLVTAHANFEYDQYFNSGRRALRISKTEVYGSTTAYDVSAINQPPVNNAVTRMSTSTTVSIYSDSGGYVVPEVAQNSGNYKDVKVSLRATRIG